ncbi:response regulator transcription factor [Campylobacter sp.]|uniref:response regulator transcription factor n=1 Tax=Campylobacter sp. TaxID=205 RepID=UPI0027061D4A|nr:response regulator transcription factor [Campylobacter sp.]
MKIGLYTPSVALLKEWKSKLKEREVISFASRTELLNNIDIGKCSLLCLEFTNDAKEIVTEILQICPEIKILLLSKEPNFNEGREFLTRGIKGYGNAHMLEIHLNDAIKSIEAGNVWLYPEFIQSMIMMMTKESLATNSAGALEKLTAKEKEIANFIYQGLTNQEIAEVANITLRTVKAHISSIFEKTGVKDRINLVLLMRKNG